jgi:acyl carrier protein
MTREEIQQKLIEMAAEQAGVPVLQVTPATHFVNDLEFDSLDFVEYSMAVEDHFKMSVSDEAAETMMTVRAVADYVAEQLKLTPATPAASS